MAQSRLTPEQQVLANKIISTIQHSGCTYGEALDALIFLSGYILAYTAPSADELLDGLQNFFLPKMKADALNIFASLHPEDSPAK